MFRFAKFTRPITGNEFYVDASKVVDIFVTCTGVTMITYFDGVEPQEVDISEFPSTAALIIEAAINA